MDHEIPRQCFEVIDGCDLNVSSFGNKRVIKKFSLTPRVNILEKTNEDKENVSIFQTPAVTSNTSYCPRRPLKSYHNVLPKTKASCRSLLLDSKDLTNLDSKCNSKLIELKEYSRNSVLTHSQASVDTHSNFNQDQLACRLNSNEDFGKSSANIIKDGEDSFSSSISSPGKFSFDKNITLSSVEELHTPLSGITTLPDTTPEIIDKSYFNSELNHIYNDADSKKCARLVPRKLSVPLLEVSNFDEDRELHCQNSIGSRNRYSVNQGEVFTSTPINLNADSICDCENLSPVLSGDNIDSMLYPAADSKFVRTTECIFSDSWSPSQFVDEGSFIPPLKISPPHNKSGSDKENQVPDENSTQPIILNRGPHKALRRSDKRKFGDELIVSGDVGNEKEQFFPNFDLNAIEVSAMNVSDYASISLNKRLCVSANHLSPFKKDSFKEKCCAISLGLDFDEMQSSYSFHTTKVYNSKGNYLIVDPENRLYDNSINLAIPHEDSFKCSQSFDDTFEFKDTLNCNFEHRASSVDESLFRTMMQDKCLHSSL